MNERVRIAGAVLLAGALLLSAGCETNTSLRESGVFLYQGGDYPAAQDKFQRAIGKADNDYQSLYWLGMTQLKLGKPVQAQVNLERALAVRFVDPVGRANILDALAESYYQQGPSRYDNLTAFLASTAALHNSSRDYLRQGTYLAKIGDVDGARTGLKKGAYFAQAGDAHPYIVIADFYRDLGDRANELVSLRYAYYVNPKHYGLADRIRALGTVPGPTVAVEPPKPEVLR